MIKTIEKNNLAHLRTQLKHGDMLMIAVALGISYKTVFNAFEKPEIVNWFTAWRIERATEERLRFHAEVAALELTFAARVKEITRPPLEAMATSAGKAGGNKKALASIPQPSSN